MLFDYYYLGLRYSLMMTAIIVTTTTQKIKNKTRLVFYFYFEPKTIGKGIFVFFLTRDKKGIEKTMNEHSLCWCYVRVMWRHRLLFMSHRRNLFFSFIDCAQSEREYKRDTFFFGHFPFFFYIIPPTSYPTLPSILSLVCPLRKDKRQSLFLRRLMADDDGGSLSFSLISRRVVFCFLLPRNPWLFFFYYLTTRPPKLFSFSSLPNSKNE